LGVLLGAVEAAPPVEAAEAAGRVLHETLGATRVSFLIADYSGGSLIRLAHSEAGGTARRLGRETAERVPLDGTPYGQALAEQAVQVLPEDDGTLLLAPVTTGGEAVGVLELLLPGTPSAAAQADVAKAAHLLAYVVIAGRRHTDLYDWGQRTVPLSLAAEIQHRLLPGSYTCEAGQFTLAAWLEPAGEVGGDTFDFSLERDRLSFSMTDAMGHTVEASLLATLLVGSVRNGRRRGADLPEICRDANAALLEHIGRSRFVTGQLGRIDLRAGTAQVVNAGHPLPLRLRDGEVDEVRLEADPPFGAFARTAFRVQELELVPGDRLLFLTDGLLEREAAKVDLHVALRETADDHPREAVRHLIEAVVKASGRHLRDDATAMCLDWHGGPPRDRDAASGADVAR
jgi:serine phosphatase RsbU (regulator of sigma subunit)